MECVFLLVPFSNTCTYMLCRSSSKNVYFCVTCHKIQFILAKTYMTLRCSAYETYNKLLGKRLSSIIHSKNKLGERI